MIQFSKLPIGLILIVVLTVQAEDPALKKDLDQLQGQWSMASGSADGVELPEAMRQSAKRVCKGDETTVTVNGQVFMKARFTLDPTKKPKSIDYDMVGGTTKGMKQLGIYELESNTVRFCFAAPGDERPAEFSSKPGDRRPSAVWKRIDEAAAEPARK